MDATIEHGDRRFVLRVAGVAFDRERVLLHRMEHDDFWAMPGGRVALGEEASVSLRREMIEEIATEVRVQRLVWVMENFFENAGKRYHELGLYFLMELPHDSPLRACESFEGPEQWLAGSGTLKLIFRWFPLSALAALPLYPTFLRQGLLALPPTTQHIVHYDSDDE